MVELVVDISYSGFQGLKEIFKSKDVIDTKLGKRTRSCLYKLSEFLMTLSNSYFLGIIFHPSCSKVELTLKIHKHTQFDNFRKDTIISYEYANFSQSDNCLYNPTITIILRNASFDIDTSKYFDRDSFPLNVLLMRDYFHI